MRSLLTNSDSTDQENFADISVIMPAYQAADTILRALQSVSIQTLKPFEVIVVDDGSNDNTFETASEFQDKMNGVNLKIIRQINTGAGAARNTAISHARGEYLAFLDADDEWLPIKIEKSFERLMDGDNLLVSHDIWTIEGDRETQLECSARFKAAAKEPFVGLYRKGFIATSSVITRRQAVLAAKGFDDTLIVGQDFDLWLKLLGSPDVQFDVFDQPLTLYYVSPYSITSQTEQRLTNTLAIAIRHAPTLRHYSGSPIVSLWFRILAVHCEATTAYWKNRKIGRCFFTLLRLPINAILLTTKFVWTTLP